MLYIPRLRLSTLIRITVGRRPCGEPHRLPWSRNSRRFPTVRWIIRGRVTKSPVKNRRAAASPGYERVTIMENLDTAQMSDLDTSRIKEWRSIVTLIIFVLASKSRMCWVRSDSMGLTCSLFCRSRGFVPLSCPNLRSSTTFECRPGYPGRTASYITKKQPLAA